MAAIVRTVLYVAVIVALVSIFLPSQVLERSGMARVSPPGILQLAGAAITLAGAGLALWCAVTFAVVGRGTPLPFDPPRRLVIAGPYRSVRNPMAIGVGSALLGAALVYESVSLFVLAGLFMLGIHAFVVSYEEPTLRRMFGAEYEAYLARVNRWLPLRPVPRSESREMVRFDVFGREIGILRSGDEWRAVYIGPDGKHRPANDVMIPSSLAGSELETYLADVFHESASPAHPNVTRLGL